jgi:predicted nucleic acid-binding protein
MTRVLIDTNVVLDVLLRREPWVVDAAAVWQLCSSGTITGYIGASSFTDIYYIARRQADKERARTALRLCLDTFAVCPIDRRALEMAYSLSDHDFEDNLQIACSLLNELDYIVTRNVGDFDGSAVAAITPADFLQHMSNQ